MERNIFAAENSWNCGDRRKTKRRTPPGDCQCLCTSVFVTLCGCIYVCIYIALYVHTHPSIYTHGMFLFEVGAVSWPSEKFQG